MNQFAILYADRFTNTIASYDDRLSHRVGRYVASAAGRRGIVAQRLEQKNLDTPGRTALA